MERAEEKKQELLRFLADEIWTMPDIVSLLLGKGSENISRQTVHALVKRLANGGFLKRFKPTDEESDRRGKRLVYVGITRAGRIEAGADPEGRVFEPSKLRDFSLDHRLYQQKVRILGTFRGWTGWQGYQRRTDTDEYGEPLPPWPIQADYVAVIRGRRVAIEAERTLKSARRYAEIWKLHAEAIEEGRWERVLYVLPTPQVKAAFDTLRSRDRIGSSRIMKSIVIDELGTPTVPTVPSPVAAPRLPKVDTRSDAEITRALIAEVCDETERFFQENGLKDPPWQIQDDGEPTDECME
jgi:DNA-binding Lrp family transcriptional regulator